MCSHFLFLFYTILEKFMFSGIYQFIPDCPICGHIVVVFSCNPLYFYVCCHFSFISDFIWALFLFFLMCLVKYQFCLAFQRTSSWFFIDLLYCFLQLSFISVLMFIISFLLTLGFALFLVPLSVPLDCFETFLVP